MDELEDRAERRRNAKPIDTSGGHEFVDPTDWGSVIPGVFCRKCLLMRRADGQNKPCAGPTKMALREKKAPLECVVCGLATGPLHPIDSDHAGWMCPTCYAKSQENE